MRVLAVVLVALIGIAACTSGAGESAAPPERDQTGSTVGGEPAGAAADVEPPAQVEATLTGDGTDATLEVSFAPSPDAEGHLVRFDDDAEPVLVEPDDCADDGCSFTFDRLTAGGVTSVTVTAVVGEHESSPTDAVELPAWPPPAEPSELDENEPITLVVTRVDGGDRLAVQTETVEPGDIEARIGELQAADDVVGIGLDGPGRASTDELDLDQFPHYPDGLATWQQEALSYEQLPASRGEGVTVAVIDRGVDEDHPALDGADISQTNVVDPGKDVPANHGTAVTSLIVGQPGGRVPGIAPNATIQAYDVFSGADSFARSDLADAIIQAADDGADVISISLASICHQYPDPIAAALEDLAVLEGQRYHFNCPSGVLQPAVDYAESQGVVVVASAGNDGPADDCEGGGWLEAEPNVDQWPAKFDSVIAVGGTARSGEPWVCSPETDYIDVLAPSNKLLVAWGNADYAVHSGNSLSAPLVAGLIAVILAEEPDLEPQEIRELLAAATGEHGRLIPSVALDTLGLLDEPAFDLTTGNALLPFTLDLEFQEGHPVHEAVLNAQGPLGSDRVEMQVNGLLMIDGDGSVTGWGAFVRPCCIQQAAGTIGGSWVSRSVRALGVACPVSGRYTFWPSLGFYWDLRGVVGGQVTDERRGRLDLSLSFGDGATPQAPGTLPGMTTVIDELDNCEHAIAWHNENVLGSGHHRWKEVQAERNQVVGSYERAYQGLVDLSPIEISDARMDGTRLQLGGSHSPVDNARVHVQVGTYRG